MDEFYAAIVDTERKQDSPADSQLECPVVQPQKLEGVPFRTNLFN
jgi:hypothetical protein